ncbi:uncharacterized protein DS421_8g233640 [Arachis hypogaea]|nr:uncharacterized protein DS421_8g233640 [Arachis hypogaea]
MRTGFFIVLTGFFEFFSWVVMTCVFSFFLHCADRFFSSFFRCADRFFSFTLC